MAILDLKGSSTSLFWKKRRLHSKGSILAVFLGFWHDRSVELFLGG